MSNITSEFVKDPAGFLATYVVFVANVEQANTTDNKPGLRDFYFWKSSGSTATLKERRFGKVPAEVIRGYWLPWETMKAVTLDLSSDANYMFTSQMTGCRFSVLTSDDTKPRVAHIAGTLKQEARQTAENKVLSTLPGKETARTRRLSVSGHKDHGYVGQTVEPSSAFVYGVRATDTGVWSFAAQIVGVNMLPKVNLPSLKTEMIMKPFAF